MEEDDGYPISHGMHYILAEWDRGLKELTDRIDAEDREMYRRIEEEENDPNRAERIEQILEEIDQEQRQYRIAQSGMHQGMELERCFGKNKNEATVEDLNEAGSKEGMVENRSGQAKEITVQKPKAATGDEVRTKLTEQKRVKEVRKTIRQGEQMKKAGQMRNIRTYFK
jgi:hypothetical protein